MSKNVHADWCYGTGITPPEQDHLLTCRFTVGPLARATVGLRRSRGQVKPG